MKILLMMALTLFFIAADVFFAAFDLDRGDMGAFWLQIGLTGATLFFLAAGVRRAR